MKVSVNSPCPCGSGKKYKKCCMIYHKGAKPKDPLTLMKSRYSAYALSNVRYIIKTTHKNNPQYNANKQEWEKELQEYCKTTTFNKLQILNHGKNVVEFIAYINDNKMHEISTFVKEEGIWYYLYGNIK